jgi:hypothetical protein
MVKRESRPGAWKAEQERRSKKAEHKRELENIQKEKNSRIREAARTCSTDKQHAKMVKASEVKKAKKKCDRAVAQANAVLAGETEDAEREAASLTADLEAQPLVPGST